MRGFDVFFFFLHAVICLFWWHINVSISALILFVLVLGWIH